MAGKTYRVKADVARFRDPVHGFIEVEPLEEKIIDSEPFQRLRRVRQLAFTNYVYHGAEHTRFGHSIGVMHCATRVFDSVAENAPKALSDGQEPGTKRLRRLRTLLRLYALLHDLGHGPYSHASEEFYPDGWNHEKVSAAMVENSVIADIIRKDFTCKTLSISPEDVANLIRHTAADPELFIMRQIMDSDADADKMDYLMRDSLYCGVVYGRYDIERLVHQYTAHLSPEGPWELAIKKGGLHAFESFILARFWMFLQVYFHPKRRFWDIALRQFVRASKLMLPAPKDDASVNEFLGTDDVWLWGELTAAARSGSEWAKLLTQRKTWKYLDMAEESQITDEHLEVFRLSQRMIEQSFADRVIVDRPENTPHHLDLARKGRDERSVGVLDGKGNVLEIMKTSEVIASLATPIRKPRVYTRAADLADVVAEWDKVRDIAKGRG